MKAIETRYAGCLFRSRLEARWAAFFDQLGIEWRYEYQGYKLSSGTQYLPDFWLPKDGWHVEVKGGDEALAATRARLEQFVQESSIRLIILGEIPHIGDVPAIHPALTSQRGAYAEWTSVKIAGWPPGTKSDPPYIIVECGDVDPVITTGAIFTDGNRPYRTVENAYAVARAARFEFGAAIPGPLPPLERAVDPNPLYGGNESVESVECAWTAKWLVNPDANETGSRFRHPGREYSPRPHNWQAILLDLKDLGNLGDGFLTSVVGRVFKEYGVAHWDELWSRYVELCLAEILARRAADRF